MEDSSYVYKSCGNYIVTLQKLSDTVTNESRYSVMNRETAKYRTNKLKVISIQNKDNPKETLGLIENTSFSKKMTYRVNKIVSVDDFNMDLEKVCSTGIHYFLDRDCAYYWEKEITDGKWINWYENGNKMSEGNYVAGNQDGKWIEWYENGNNRERNYVAGREKKE